MNREIFKAILRSINSDLLSDITLLQQNHKIIKAGTIIDSDSNSNKNLKVDYLFQLKPLEENSGNTE